MKKTQLYTLRKGITACIEFRGGSFQYALAKNSKKLTREIKAIEEAMDNAFPFPEKYSEFEDKRKELQEKHGGKDDKGNLIVTKGGQIEFATSTDKENFDKKFKIIQKKYQKILDEVSDLGEKRKEFLEEDCASIDWHMIKQEDIPELANGNLILIEPFLED